MSQTYPGKPIRIIVPLSAGSSTDLVMRLLAPKLSEGLGQPIVIENMPGAGGGRGSDVVAKSAPDGYTLLLGTSSSHGINVSLYAKMPYDAVNDFTPITLVGYVPFVMMAHPNLGVKNIRELIALAKAKPGQINYASSGNGTSSHLGMEMFKTMTDVDLRHIPYKGTNQANADLIAGHVSLQLDAIPVSLPLARSGKVIGLGVTSPKRIALAPDIPGINETVPGFEFTAWIGFWAPAGTPRAVINLLNTEIIRVLSQPDIKDRLVANGWEVTTSTPEAFGTFIKREIDKWAAVVKTSGARVD
jgi:tripartite-type tricarboxylate transporter receptor subunit TctC